MEQSFQREAMSVLLDSVPNLTDGEKAMLKGLRAAAERGRYCETIEQLRTVPHAPMVIYNIAQKGRASGLGPILEGIRKDLQ